MVEEIASNPDRSDTIVNKDGLPSKQTIVWFDDIELTINELVNTLGTGGFVGPPSAVPNNLVAFLGPSGNQGKDSGIPLAKVVQGPASAGDENIAIYDNITGKLLKDSGVQISDFGDVSGPDGVVSANIAVFDGGSGKIIEDGLISVDTLLFIINLLMVGAGSSITDNLVSFANTSGRIAKDSGISANDVVIGPASTFDNRLAVFNGGSGKVIKDGGKSVASVVTNNGTAADLTIAIFDGATGKLIQDSGTTISDLLLLIFARGDVFGPGSSVNNRLALFNGTTGKNIKQSSILESQVGNVKGPGSSTTNRIALFSNGTGKLIKQSSLLESQIGIVVKIQEATFSNDITVTSVIPLDNSIPQTNEGTQVMNIPYTPLFSGSKLVIDCFVMAAGRSNGLTFSGYIASVFDQASLGNVLNAAYSFFTADTGAAENAYVFGTTTHLTHTFTTVSTAAKDFRVRLGKIDAAQTNVTFNGSSGAALLGAIPKSRIRITEYRQ